MNGTLIRWIIGTSIGFMGLIAVEITACGQSPTADLAVPSQPLLAQIHRVSEALEVVGKPLSDEKLAQLNRLKQSKSELDVAAGVQKILDPLCLVTVDVAETGPPTIKVGAAERELLEQGWRTFLIKVINRPGRTGRLFVESPNARPLPYAPAEEVTSRWMQISSFEGQPMRANLSGLALEYRILQIYSRDKGPKSAILEFNVSGDPNGDRDLIREWRFDEDTDGWNEMNQIRLAVQNGSLEIESSGSDPFMGSTVDGAGGPMMLRFWAKTSVAGIGQVFWWTKDIPYPTPERQTNFILEPNKEHLYEIPFHVDGELAGVRIDPLVKPGRMRVDWIDLYSAQRSENWAKRPLEFQSVGATPVTFRIKDGDLPALAKFEIRDSTGQIYPAQSKRLAPDFFFQRHIYRADGETISLPPGQYTITCSRGPETKTEPKSLVVGEEPVELNYQVQRWIDPSRLGWWSGDHHIHAAGCLHYDNPTQGVKPVDMIRHIMGEDLKVGCCLTWGPCFDYQKRFFTGEVAEQSRYPYTLRYDVEVSGFGSHMSGHLNLLDLKEQIYPGGESKDHWPTLGLNTLRWAKRQGAVCGPAHSSIGLSRFVGRVPDTEGQDGPNMLPNFQVPAFDGIGANEFIVDVTHRVPGPEGELIPAVDFISTMNTERVAEWNMWYHVLNCGLRVAASGETDFPCMSGERVGIGRVYAQVEGKLTFQKWVRSIAAGRSYVSDGLCHLLDFSASHTPSNKNTRLGIDGSELSIADADNITFSLKAAALLGNKDLTAELIVNGYPVATQTIPGDGSMTEITFDHSFDKSGWAAVRVFPNAHTNPIYVVVDEQPIRGTLDSVRWCLAGVEQCWKSKQPTYAVEEQADARAAYEHARAFYQRLLDERQ
ncbi:MAG: CehA/McbA family metallohydrolase [Planctomycetota bacterium]